MRNRSDLDIPGAASERAWRVYGELVDDVAQAQFEICRHEATQAETLGRLFAVVWDDAKRAGVDAGWQVRAIQAEVATALRLSERVVTTMMELGRQLTTRFPQTLTAWRRAEMSRRHVEVIVDELKDVVVADDDTEGVDPEVFAQLETALVDAARDRTPAELRREALRLRERAQAESAQARHEAAKARRCVALDPAADGMAWLGILLPAADAAAAFDRTRHIALGIRAAGDTERTVAQVQADVVRDLLITGVGAEPQHDGAATSEAESTTSASTGSGHALGTGVRAHINIVVPALGLIRHVAQAQGAAGTAEIAAGVELDESDESDESAAKALAQAIADSSASELLAELEGYGPIDMQTAAELCAGATSFTRILTDPVTGVVLTHDRTTYRPPAELRRFVRNRDGTCQFAGCLCPASSCEIDHTINWEWDGPTDENNLACLCRRHHVMKHQTDWKVKNVGGGMLHWTSPTGSAVKGRPSPVVAFDKAPF